MREKGIEMAFRDLDKDRLMAEEIDRLIGDRDYREFLNSRNELYRNRNMKEHPPSRAEALKLMAAHPNLIRRPVVIAGKEIILGYDEPKLKALKA
ncbi:MAG: arsenate reductase family protein [Candidatus Acidiferrales bacterium]